MCCRPMIAEVKRNAGLQRSNGGNSIGVICALGFYLLQAEMKVNVYSVSAKIIARV